MEIKIRGISKAAVSSIDEKAKDLGYKSRNEFLKVYLEREFLLLDKIKEHEGIIRALTDLTIMIAILTFVVLGVH